MEKKEFHSSYGDLYAIKELTQPTLANYLSFFK